jgi:hypothetical protein
VDFDQAIFQFAGLQTCPELGPGPVAAFGLLVIVVIRTAGQKQVEQPFRDPLPGLGFDQLAW